MQKAALRTAGVVFLLVGVLHVWRLVAKAEVMVGAAWIPSEWSVAAAVIAFGLASWMFYAAKK